MDSSFPLLPFLTGLALGALLGALTALLFAAKRRALALHEEQACLQAALDPIRSEFASLSTLLSETRAADAAHAAALQQQLAESLHRVDDLVLRVNHDTHTLKTALQGNIHLRGQWGEAILEQLLRQSGLLPGIHYSTQVSLKPTRNAALNDSRRPDAIVHLPNGTQIIIDSKNLFPEYTRALEASSPEERKTALQEHVKSFRSTLSNLASKHYEQRIEGSLDFVLMFLPLESAYYAAVSSDPALLTEALKHNILPVGPSALILMLSLIQRIWQREEQSRNTLHILEAARILADRTVAFQSNLSAIGDSLQKAQDAYNKTLRLATSTDPQSKSIALSLKTLQSLQGKSR